MNSTLADFAFYLLAGVALATALASVLHKSLVIAALNLVLMMLSLAGIFLLLAAPFLAALQVIVYSGAIMVLFVFAIMLLNAPEDRSGNAVSKRRKLGAAVATLGFFGAIANAALGNAALAQSLNAWPSGRGALGEAFGAPGVISGVLLNDLAVPFEVVSLLLTVAMIGAVMLAKRNLAQSDGEAAS
jgi:NADH-quinone oxidoreductase subunit J